MALSCDEITTLVGTVYSPTKDENVYAKEIWNAAIEAAANEADNATGWSTPEEIRKLKK